MATPTPAPTCTGGRARQQLRGHEHRYAAQGEQKANSHQPLAALWVARLCPVNYCSCDSGATFVFETDLSRPCQAGLSHIQGGGTCVCVGGGGIARRRRWSLSWLHVQQQGVRAEPVSWRLSAASWRCEATWSMRRPSPTRPVRTWDVATCGLSITTTLVWQLVPYSPLLCAGCVTDRC
jgi:hypothetical protein